MDKTIIALLAAFGGVALLFLPRLARGEVEEITVTEKQRGPLVASSSPKGIRNNNPFNLEYRNIGWVGEVGTDGRFSIFDSPINGLRAGMINIHTKIFRDGANTVRDLISLLSPAFENPTEAFITFVSQRVGKAPDQPLDFRQDIFALSKAIVRFENGPEAEAVYTDAQYVDALRLTGLV